MTMRFNYPYKTRDDFLKDVVSGMIKRRFELGLRQDELEDILGVSIGQISKWENGIRTPTSFNLYCWADALDGQITYISNQFASITTDQNKALETDRFKQFYIESKGGDK